MRLALLLVVATLATAIRPAWSTIIDASEAARYVGSAVTVEGDVTDVRTEIIGLVLELGPPGPTSVRAVLVPALISGLPRSPERVYAGKRVRVTGLIQRFHGRPELVLESAGQIEIVDVAGAPSSSTTTIAAPVPSPTTTQPAAPPTPPSTVAPPAAASVPETPPPPAPTPVTPPTPPPPATTAVAPPAPPPAPAPVVTTPPATTPPLAVEPEPAPKPLLAERLAAQACNRARERWQTAASRTREATATLTRCLDATPFACHEAAAALAPILAELEWAEQQVAERCD